MENIHISDTGLRPVLELKMLPVTSAQRGCVLMVRCSLEDMMKINEQCNGMLRQDKLTVFSVGSQCVYVDLTPTCFISDSVNCSSCPSSQLPICIPLVLFVNLISSLLLCCKLLLCFIICCCAILFVVLFSVCSFHLIELHLRATVISTVTCINWLEY